MNCTTIKPSLLVSLKTTVRGNVSYSRRTIESEHVTAEGALEAKWETEKKVLNAAEHNAAKKARADARNAITATCAHSAFGLLCPVENEEALKESIGKANAIADAFNRTAQVSRIQVYVIMGRIADNDADAAAAIHSEIIDLLMEMDEALEAADAAKAREACNKARELNIMLQPEANKTLQHAIDTVRNVARKIVKGGGFEIDQARVTLELAMGFFAGPAR